MEPMQPNDVRGAVEAVPRVRLGHLPTPLEPMPRVCEVLGGPPLWIKRDDCTGLAFGGNKTRHNEYIFGQAQRQGAEVFVWGAGVQSNNCRQTAAACAKLGIECRLLLSRSHFRDEVQGNLLLDHLLGADVQVVDEPIGPALDERITTEAQRLRSQGRNVFAWDRALKPVAAVGYVLCLVEIVEQLAAVGQRPQAVYVCSAGSTGAGLALAAALLGSDIAVRSIAPIRWPWDAQEDMARIATDTARLLGLDHTVQPEQVEVTEDYIGPDYGVCTPEGRAAIDLVAGREGILRDPIYTGKAMAALIDDVRGGRLSGNAPVVFVHTGGTPALFAYREQLLPRH